MKILIYLFILVHAFACIAFPVRSSIGGKTISFSNEEEVPSYTAADYVMDGLVSMWDGIENAGWGVHEDNPAKWIDLVGNDSLVPYGSSSSSFYETWFGDDALQGKPYWNTPKSAELYSALVGSSRTAEIVITKTADGTIYGNVSLISGNWFSFAGYVGNQFLCRYENTNIWIASPSAAPYIWSITMSADNGVCDVYVNGQFLRTVTSGGMTPSGNGNMFIGQNLQSVNGSSTFAQTIHSVRVYNRALSEAEVKSNFKVDKVRFMR